MRIKLCGITNVDDARLCVEAGADALGFIFVTGTPRCVSAETAARIIETLPPFVTPVGVFWDHPAGQVKAISRSRARYSCVAVVGLSSCAQSAPARCRRSARSAGSRVSAGL